jgi:hypothetical protein
MRLAVLGRQSLDELQALVTDKFSAVPNHSLPVPKFSGGCAELRQQWVCQLRSCSMQGCSCIAGRVLFSLVQWLSGFVVRCALP